MDSMSGFFAIFVPSEDEPIAGGAGDHRGLTFETHGRSPTDGVLASVTLTTSVSTVKENAGRVADPPQEQPEQKRGT